MFCGGTAALGVATATATGCRRPAGLPLHRHLPLLDDHGLDGRMHLWSDLDLDHMGSELPDRLLEPHLAPVDPEVPCLLHGLHDLLRRDRAVKATILPCRVANGQHGLRKECRSLLNSLLLLARCPLGLL